MSLLLTIMLAVSPAIANDSKAVPTQGSPVLADEPVGNFEEEAESVFERLRRLMFTSHEKKQVRKIDEALAKHDPASAQKALDTLLREYPELKKDEPQAVEFHQANIDFWRGDFNSAYTKFDAAIKELEKIYPNGIVPAGPYQENNSSFLAELYLSRGVTALNQHKYAQAILDIDKAIAVSPKPWAYMQINKCRAHLRLKQYKESAEAYSLAYKLNPAWSANAENKEEFCATLEKNGFHPQPCQSKQ